MKRFLFFMLLIFPYNVFAHEINSIKMDVFINEDGSASVIEEWNTYINAEENSSEGFRSFSMIDNSNIFDFKVIDEDGLLYKNIDNWNSNLSFEEKANTSGIKRFNNGKNIELCWGLSENGYKKYKLYYNISNFVHQYKDYQGIYFNMLSLDYDVNDVDINIKSNNFFYSDRVKVWGMGFDGISVLNNGSIYMSPKSELSSNENMTILVKFKDNYFNINNKTNKKFNIILLQFKFNKFLIDTRDFFYSILPFLLHPQFLLFVLIFVGINIKKKLLNNDFNRRKKDFRYKKVLTKDGNLIFIKDKNANNDNINIEYFREIPCDKNIFVAYWIANNYGVSSTETLQKGLIGAILLKWVKSNVIAVVKKKNLFGRKKYKILFSQRPNLDNKLEIKLFDMLKEASGVNESLEDKEFEKWSADNYISLVVWFNQINSYVKKYLENNLLINKNSGIFLNANMENNIQELSFFSNDIDVEAKKLLGLKKFLTDFGLISEKGNIEVNLWEEYLIFAELFGVASKVMKEFNKLYPKGIELMNIDMSSLDALSNFSGEFYNNYSSANNSNYLLNDYSSSDNDSWSSNTKSSYKGPPSSGSSGGGFR